MVHHGTGGKTGTRRIFTALIFLFLGFNLRKTAISIQATVRCKWYTYHRRITRNNFSRSRGSRLKSRQGSTLKLYSVNLCVLEKELGDHCPRHDSIC